MEGQTHLQQTSPKINYQSFSRVVEDRNQLPSQDYVMNASFDYNPFSCYQPYWGLQDQYHFNKQMLVAHQQYWTQRWEENQRVDQHNLRNNIQYTTLLQETPKENTQHQRQDKNKNGNSKPTLPKRKYKTQKCRRHNHSIYYWSKEQNKRYADFLSKNAELFSLSVNQRKNLRKVKTRTPQQCHSHHQKMMKKYGSIPTIIQTMRLQRQQLQYVISSRQRSDRVQIQGEVHNNQDNSKDQI